MPQQKALVKCMCSLLCLYCCKSVRRVFGLGAQQCCPFSLLLMLHCCPLVSDAFVIVLSIHFRSVISLSLADVGSIRDQRVILIGELSEPGQAPQQLTMFAMLSELLSGTRHMLGIHIL